MRASQLARNAGVSLSPRLMRKISSRTRAARSGESVRAGWRRVSNRIMVVRRIVVGELRSDRDERERGVSVRREHRTHEQRPCPTKTVLIRGTCGLLVRLAASAGQSADTLRTAPRSRERWRALREWGSRIARACGYRSRSGPALWGRAAPAGALITGGATTRATSPSRSAQEPSSSQVGVEPLATSPPASTGMHGQRLLGGRIELGSSASSRLCELAPLASGLSPQGRRPCEREPAGRASPPN